MKKLLAVCAAIVACIVVAAAAACSGGNGGDYLRIHIRANSNDAADQDVKYAVKEAIVKAVTPMAAQAKSKGDMEILLAENLSKLEREANAVLARNGFAYRAKCSLRSEQFPSRSYGELTLPAGEYDALIVELGKADGNNWWCVAFPPLCFTGTEENGANKIGYKSKIKETIDRIIGGK